MHELELNASGQEWPGMENLSPIQPPVPNPNDQGAGMDGASGRHPLRKPDSEARRRRREIHEVKWILNLGNYLRCGLWRFKQYRDEIHLIWPKYTTFSPHSFTVLTNLFKRMCRLHRDWELQCLLHEIQQVFCFCRAGWRSSSAWRPSGWGRWGKDGLQGQHLVLFWLMASSQFWPYLQLHPSWKPWTISGF